MADVSRVPAGDGDESDRDDRSRGQVILVAGLAVAVTLVALVLLLNTVIYTQNLATRGPAVEDGEAVAFQREVTAGVGEAIDAENRAGYDGNDELEANVKDAVTRYDNLSSRYAAGRGTIADVEESTLSLSEGTLLHQTDDSRTFTSAGGDGKWTLVENVASVRRFRATVSGESLSDGDSGAFTVFLDGESVTHRFYVYNDSQGDIAVSSTPDGSAPGGCTASGPEATVDFTAGTVGGTHCAELDYPTGGDEYNVTFENGTKAEGTYELTVGLARDEVETGNFSDPATDSSPRAVPAVYSATFEIHFETPDLEFHTTVRAARGEPE